MDRRLESIENWETRLYLAKYRLTRLAQGCGVSRRGLYSYISKTYGCGPRVWIQRMRLEAARELFSSGKSLKEIAEHLGLTPSSLNRLVQRATGNSSSIHLGGKRGTFTRRPEFKLEVVQAPARVAIALPKSQIVA